MTKQPYTAKYTSAFIDAADLTSTRMDFETTVGERETKAKKSQNSTSSIALRCHQHIVVRTLFSLYYTNNSRLFLAQAARV